MNVLDDLIGPNRYALGHGHVLSYTCWRPDRELNPQFAGIPDIERLGASIEHLTPAGEPCVSAIYFDTPEVRRLITDERAMWQVHSMEPLTLSPSLLCRAPLPDGGECGDHGFIQGGRWVPA